MSVSNGSGSGITPTGRLWLEGRVGVSAVQSTSTALHTSSATSVTSTGQTSSTALPLSRGTSSTALHTSVNLFGTHAPVFGISSIYIYIYIYMCVCVCI